MPELPKMEPKQIPHEGSSQHTTSRNDDLMEKNKELVEIFKLVMNTKLTKDFETISITNLRLFLIRLSKMERTLQNEYDRQTRSMFKEVKKQRNEIDSEYNWFGKKRNAK